MTFKERIDAIITDNPLGINSISTLEKYLGMGNYAIRRVYNSPTMHPSIKVVRRIIEGLSINQTWWNTGNGPMYRGVRDATNKMLRQQIKDMEEKLELYRKLLLQTEIENIELNLRLQDYN